MKTITKNVQSISDITADYIPEAIFNSEQPIILKGLIKHWPLVQTALNNTQSAIKTLIQSDTQKPAPVYFGHNKQTRRLGYNHDCSKLNFDIKQTNLTQILTELMDNLANPDYPVRYIASNILQIHFPDIHQQNHLSFDYPYFQQNPLEGADPLTGIWIGNQTLSPCHWDAQSNIACCVAGKRKFTLFPPDQVENLYPGPLELTPGGQPITLVDFDNPDFERFPKFANAIEHGQIAELEPGDAIFIPCMWWHQVETQDTFNILINYWWNSFAKSRGQAINVLQHAFLSLRDRPKAEKQAWKHLFDYYIFGEDNLAAQHLAESSRGVLGEIDNLQSRQLRAMLLNKLNR
ncbi:cupin-like domain-containing protein [Catenovulum sp. 2E275]|nr:cupin-like domain-containing protein [Catenovulum sp. 2E275]